MGGEVGLLASFAATVLQHRRRMEKGQKAEGQKAEGRKAEGRKAEEWRDGGRVRCAYFWQMVAAMVFRARHMLRVRGMRWFSWGHGARMRKRPSAQAS